MSYQQFLSDHASKGDFVYLDPPYIPISKYSDFDRYSKEKFGIGQQIDLSLVFDRLIDNGVTALLSNSSSYFVERFYKKHRSRKYTLAALLIRMETLVVK